MRIGEQIELKVKYQQKGEHMNSGTDPPKYEIYKTNIALHLYHLENIRRPWK